MNETASDGSDSENHKDVAPPESKSDPYISLPVVGDQKTQALNPELDFFTKQAKLQTEARTALTQAKELARVQMQVERQQRKRNRISDLVRQSLERVRKPYREIKSFFFLNFVHCPPLVGHTVSVGVSSTESPDSHRDEHCSIAGHC